MPFSEFTSHIFAPLSFKIAVLVAAQLALQLHSLGLVCDLERLVDFLNRLHPTIGVPPSE